MIIISPILRLALKTASIVLFAITLAAAYGGHINPEYMTAPSVLVLALPYLAVATLIVGLIWLIKGRLIMAVLAGFTLFAGWSTLKDVTPIAFSKKAKVESHTFKIISFNCLHLADTTKSDLPGNRALTYLTQSGADIICLQEMMNFEDPSEIHHWSRGAIDSLYAVYPYRAGTFDNDLKVLSKYPVRMLPSSRTDKEEDEYWRKRRRWRLFEVEIYGRRLPLVNFHMPSFNLSDDERYVVKEIKGVSTAKQSYREFRREIFPKMGVAFRERAKAVEDLIACTEGMSPLIACGDFNDVAGGWSYRLMRSAGFEDAYSETNFGPTNTFNQFLFLFHIDQIFYRGPGLEALKVKRNSLNSSDHYPMEAEFELN